MTSDPNEFREDTKRTLCDRAGGLCSFCQSHTKAASAEAPDAVSSIGEAAHIRGAHRNSRRFDEGMTPEQRRACDNGIWLCRNCHGRVDRDEVTFTVAVLTQWKANAEAAGMGRQGRPTEELPVVDWAVAAYATTYKDYVVTLSLRNPAAAPMTVMGATLTVGTMAPVHSSAPLTNRGVQRWLDPQRVRLEGRDGVEGSWFFGWSFDGGGDRLELPPGVTVGLLTLRLATGATVAVPTDIVNLATWHDARAKQRQLVEEVGSKLTKSALHEVLEALGGRHLAFMSQMEPIWATLETIKKSFPLSSPPEAKTGLPALDDLRASLTRLASFVATRFFPFPSAGGASDHDRAVALWPDGNVDRGSPTPEQEARYRELSAALDDLLDDATRAFDCFEATVSVMR